MSLNNNNLIKNTKSSEDFNEFIDKFIELTEETDSFLSCDSIKSKNFIDLTKKVFDFNKRLIKDNINKSRNIYSIKSSLDELFTTGFDEEQVWQQIQLYNEPLLDLLVKEVSTVVVKGSHFDLNAEENEDKTPENELIDESFEFNEMSEDIESDDQKSKSKEKTKPKLKKVRIIEPKKRSIVDDMFFKLHELEEFLNSEDIKEEHNISGVKELMSEESDEDVDLFEDSLSDSSDSEEPKARLNPREAMFDDFFDAPIDQNTINKSNDSSDKSSDEDFDEEINDEIDTRDVDMNDIEDNNENNNQIDLNLIEDPSDDSEEELMNRRQTDISDENKSEFERISETLKEKIEKQERLNLMSKSWQMSGEIVSDKRPENSLLEEHLHFDHTSRPAPLITEETTVKLEDIIKQRVKDSAFDDVLRKVKPKEKPFEYRRRITMESEKSKQSLAEIYENEYIKQQQKDSETQQNPIHLHIRKLMRNLFVRLDALSNFNFTPRPPQPEIKIINNLPAITAEEVTPVTATDVSLLAPQEVFNNQKRELQSNAEKSKTDRKRSRRIKKKIQSKRSKFDKSKPIKTKSKDPKKGSAETKHLSSSKKFFEKLQQKNTEVVNKKKLKTNNTIKESNKMKL